MAKVAITPVRDLQDIADVTHLVWAFFDFLRSRYPERAAQLDSYIANQDVAATLDDFASYFNPPNGECLLARMDGEAVGTLMLKRRNDTICELNRMYVAPEARGQGIGRQLANALIAMARSRGYSEIRLGALNRHAEALPLYRSLGFTDLDDPAEFAAGDPGVINMRLYL